MYLPPQPKWENFGTHSGVEQYITKVPGGWLLRTLTEISRAASEVEMNQGQSIIYQTFANTIFIPDINHEWGKKEALNKLIKQEK